MKTWFLLMVLLLALAGGNAALAATNAPPSEAELERLLMEAVLLKQHGQYALAEERLKKLAEAMPDQPMIKQLLAEVQAQQRAKEDQPAAVLKRRLDRIVLPAVNFREAAPEDVLAFLRAEAKRLDKESLNIVWLVPPDAQLLRVTLSLEKVPLSAVLQYFCSMSGLQYRVDAHAVVITKAEPATPKPAPSAPTNAQP